MKLELSDLDSVWTDDDEDDEEPDVGEEREDHGDDEDRVGLYPPGLPRGNDSHADGGDDQEVESSWPNNKTWAELVLLEVIEENSNDREQYFWSWPGPCQSSLSLMDDYNNDDGDSTTVTHENDDNDITDDDIDSYLVT